MRAAAKKSPSSSVMRIILIVLVVVFLLGVTVSYLWVQPYLKMSKSVDHLKRIILFVHNHEDKYHALPNGYPAGAKHRFSWRVQLLPFMGAQGKSLFDRFHFDEPWDSPHNLKVAKQMPDIYRTPFAPEDSIHTSFVAIADPQGAFPEPETPEHRLSFNSIVDGTGQTVGIVHCEGTGIVWTEPRDINIDEFVQLAKTGRLNPPSKGYAPMVVRVAMMDGSVAPVLRDVSEETLRAICTREGHEARPKDFK
ncbi:DUF1559 family PulG-like putative transporter [Anatilimnocola floriformis]|uniref:DUF1559 family PulG-like putative transporter n=1 Tax=Anatilimnocola floriformis TaxID=2948575 RepID=UPI0020C22EAC|nr:DUF1559 domain-containing protein [Anatilimnocola floriformis]